MAGRLNIFSLEENDKEIMDTKKSILGRLENYSKFQKEIAEGISLEEYPHLSAKQKNECKTLILPSEYKLEEKNPDEVVFSFRNYIYQNMKVDYEIHYDSHEKKVIAIFLVM